jgi:hypothetical protein
MTTYDRLGGKPWQDISIPDAKQTKVVGQVSMDTIDFPTWPDLSSFQAYVLGIPENSFSATFQGHFVVENPGVYVS